MRVLRQGIASSDEAVQSIMNGRKGCNFSEKRGKFSKITKEGESDEGAKALLLWNR